MINTENIMYTCKKCGWCGYYFICPECGDELEEYGYEEYEPDLPECMQGNADSEKHCEFCGNELFDRKYEICHICYDAYICEHCQNEAIINGFRPDTCTFCAQKIWWCKNCQCSYTVKELEQFWNDNIGSPTVLLCPWCNSKL